MDAGTCVSPWPWFSSWPFIRGLFLDRGPKSQWSTIRLLTRTVTSPASASSGSCVAGPYQDRRQPRCATRLTFEKCKCADRKAALQIQGLAGVSTISGSWTPLGPSPLASDATGFGGQDYGAVSGRATSVAVDPADPTGNTVYVGVPMEESGNPATQDRLARPMLSGLPSLNTKPRWRSARWSLCNLQSGRGAFGRQLSEPSNSLLHRSTCEKHLFI